MALGQLYLSSFPHFYDNNIIFIFMQDGFNTKVICEYIADRVDEFTRPVLL